MEVSSSDQMKENHEDPWEFLEKELQEFEKAMKALEEGNLQVIFNKIDALSIQINHIMLFDFRVFCMSNCRQEQFDNQNG